MQKVFNFFQDPGHGWVKVPIKILEELGIEKKISTYSYYRNGNAYLEEDGDLSLFMSRMRETKNETIFEGFFTNGTSKIRNYEYYKKQL